MEPSAVRDVLEKLVKKLGVSGAAARLLISEKRLRDWRKAPDSVLRRIHESNRQRLRVVAVAEGFGEDVHNGSGLLWDFGQPYDANVARVPPQPEAPDFVPKNHDVVFLGIPLSSRFGVSASVLTSSAHRVAFFSQTCCDVITLKTVRSRPMPSHPWPNVFFLTHELTDLNPDSPPRKVKVIGPESGLHGRYGSMNRYGMPSPGPQTWIATYQKARSLLLMPERQLIIVSVVGTAPDGKRGTLIADFADVAGMAVEAGALVIELNFSCPNCGERAEGSVYHDPRLAKDICAAVRERVGDRARVLVKLGYLAAPDLMRIVRSTVEYVDGYSLINTIPAEGEQEGAHGLVPAYGQPGLTAGLSGGPIREAGLASVRNLATIRRDEQLEFAIVGMGGVSEPQHVAEYLSAGADLVVATTVFMYKPYFGRTVRKYLDADLAYGQMARDSQAEYSRLSCMLAVRELRQEGVAVSDQHWESEFSTWLDRHMAGAVVQRANDEDLVASKLYWRRQLTRRR